MNRLLLPARGRRLVEMIGRMKAVPTIPPQLKLDIEQSLNQASPRFERYATIVLALAEVESVKEF